MSRDPSVDLARCSLELNPQRGTPLYLRQPQKLAADPGDTPFGDAGFVEASVTAGAPWPDSSPNIPPGPDCDADALWAETERDSP